LPQLTPLPPLACNNAILQRVRADDLSQITLVALPTGNRKDCGSLAMCSRFRVRKGYVCASLQCLPGLLRTPFSNSAMPDVSISSAQRIGEIPAPKTRLSSCLRSVSLSGLRSWFPIFSRSKATKLNSPRLNSRSVNCGHPLSSRQTISPSRTRLRGMRALPVRRARSENKLNG
jgi:hypothetical protein